MKAGRVGVTQKIGEGVRIRGIGFDKELRGAKGNELM